MQINQARFRSTETPDIEFERLDGVADGMLSEPEVDKCDNAVEFGDPVIVGIILAVLELAAGVIETAKISVLPERVPRKIPVILLPEPTVSVEVAARVCPLKTT